MLDTWFPGLEGWPGREPGWQPTAPVSNHPGFSACHAEVALRAPPAAFPRASIRDRGAGETEAAAAAQKDRRDVRPLDNGLAEPGATWPVHGRRPTALAFLVPWPWVRPRQLSTTLSLLRRMYR